jgi:hypothetical protein
MFCEWRWWCCPLSHVTGDVERSSELGSGL